MFLTCPQTLAGPLLPVKITRIGCSIPLGHFWNIFLNRIPFKILKNLKILKKVSGFLDYPNLLQFSKSEGKIENYLFQKC